MARRRRILSIPESATRRLPPGLRTELDPVVALGRRLVPRGSLRGVELTPPHALAAAVVLSILLLATARVADWPAALGGGLEVVLACSFVLLALTDFRLAVGVVVCELALGGAGGQWAILPGGISGRNFLLAVVIGWAGVTLAARFYRERRISLGRYGLHAAALAAVMPAVWIPLGIANGFGPSDALADGNAVLFMGFALALVLLVEQGSAAWLRSCLFVACAINAAFLALVVAGIETGIVSLAAANDALVGDLDLGGTIGRMADGTTRIYLGTGLYLQVGLALTTWRLMRRPRSGWLWLLFFVLWIGVVASFTRGFWLGSIVAVVIVVLLGSATASTALRTLGLGFGVAGVALLVLLASGFLTTAALEERLGGVAGTFADEERQATPFPPAPQVRIGASGAPSQPGLYVQEGGPRAVPKRPPHAYRPSGAPALPNAFPGTLSISEASDSVRRHQATVLWRHVRERPLLGSGFGASAPEYRYSRGYTYELTYLSLLFKTGVLGTLLFLSLPLRLLFDAARGRMGRLDLAAGMPPQAAAVPIAIVGGLLLLGATNPYLLAAFGLAPILLSIAWLEPGGLDLERPNPKFPRQLGDR